MSAHSFHKCTFGHGCTCGYGVPEMKVDVGILQPCECKNKGEDIVGLDTNNIKTEFGYCNSCVIRANVKAFESMIGGEKIVCKLEEKFDCDSGIHKVYDGTLAMGKCDIKCIRKTLYITNYARCLTIQNRAVYPGNLFLMAINNNGFNFWIPSKDIDRLKLMSISTVNTLLECVKQHEYDKTKLIEENGKLSNSYGAMAQDESQYAEKNEEQLKELRNKLLNMMGSIKRKLKLIDDIEMEGFEMIST